MTVPSKFHYDAAHAAWELIHRNKTTAFAQKHGAARIKRLNEQLIDLAEIITAYRGHTAVRESKMRAARAAAETVSVQM